MSAPTLPRLIRRLTRSTLALFVLLLVAGCAQNPVTGKADFVMVSEEQELRIGRAYDQQVKKENPIYDHRNRAASGPALGQQAGPALAPDTGLAAYVEALGQKLAKQSHRAGLEYRFTVLDTPDVNAFALPGGFIYITRGILAYLNSEAELAAVLGHEIGHVTARHSVRQMSAEQGANIGLTIASIFLPGLRNQAAGNLSNLAANALLSGYGREHELEADRLGAEYLVRSGYPPQAMIQVISVLKNQELFDAQLAREENRPPRAYHGLFATHPENDTRLKEVVSEAARVASGGGVVTAPEDSAASAKAGRDAFLAHMDGTVFADNTVQGVVRGNVFYHAELGLVMQFAPDWRVLNLPDRLRAIAPGGEATIEVRPDTPPKGAPPQDLLKRKVAVDGEIDTAPVNGHAAAIANVRGANVRAGAMYLGSGDTPKAFVLIGQTKTADLFKRHVEAFNSTFKTMRGFTDADRKTAEPLRMRIITATAATRYADLAKNSPLGRHAEQQLRLMNAQFPAGEPVPGQKLKVIE